MNPLLNDAAIELFLNSFPSKSRRRGKHYYTDHAVLEMSCLEQDRKYEALVRGSKDYQVVLEYDAAAGWDAECTCPLGFECKHAFAAMLALRANAGLLSSPANANSKRKKAKQTVKVVREEPQPPASPLCTALTRAIGRKLNREEVDYVQRIQWLYNQARQGYSITAESLRHLAPALRDCSWAPLSLWPELPRDDSKFWLYCAWELERRQLSIPIFMEPVTDLGLIEPAMKAWERRKLIDSWRANLANGSVEETLETDVEPVDFRLLIFPKQARVQWKRVSEKDFKDLKQTHLRELIANQQSGEMSVVPEASPLWLALYNPYDDYTPCNFNFEREETAKALGRVFRSNEAWQRVFAADGNPLERSGEALRYDLQAASNETEDYVVNLVRADGSPSPPLLLAIPGSPALYLSERALYHGPPPHNFDMRKPLRIPAPALECLEGVNFLDRLKVELPPRIAERTRRVPVAVKLACQVKPTYQGSQTEAAFLRITAKLKGGDLEVCGPSGWFADRFRGRASQASAEDGIIPLLDRSAQKYFPARLEELDAKWDNYHNAWRLRLTKSFPATFLQWLEGLPPEIEVQLDGELATLRNAPVSGSVRLDLEEAGVDWFDLKVALNVSDTELTPEELKLLLNARGGYVRLGKKGWRRLQFDLSQEDDERLARLGLNPRDFTAEPQRLHALQLADDAARKFLPEQQAEAIHRRAAELKTRVTPPVPAAIGAELRPYQVEGFHFLAYLTANRFGGVLADDMGLGKTVQTLTWLAWLREQRQPAPASPTNGNGHSNGNGNGHANGANMGGAAPGGNGSSNGHANGKHANETSDAPASVAGSALPPSVVVCPKSVMENWENEARRFCSGLRVRLWKGEEASELAAARAETDLLVLNYAQLRSLSPDIAQHRWLVAILDEAQYIKNPDSQTAQIARTLQADHRLALTGTPIENRLLDLWSILAFSMPGVLGNRAHFTRRFNQQDDPFARRRLAARVRPFLLRRTKSQVAQDLPDRVEEDLVCELEGEQKTLYRAEFKRAQQMLLNVRTQQELNEQRFNFLTSLLRLRQICCHPALVSAELRKAESSKLNALLEMLEPLMEEGHKVLVFSQFVSMLEILRASVEERGWPHFYLAGDTENRGALVEKFQSAEGAAVFLISLKAGGFGLNLTAASYVVLFDPWWNPAVEMQAIDRTHRIGQTSKVIAYRLLVKDSIEQKIRQLQRTKAALAEDVLGEEKFGQALTLDDLRFLFAE